MKIVGEHIDETDYAVIPGYLYSDEHEDRYYVVHEGVIIKTFRDLDAFEESERRASDSFQEWFGSFE